MDTFVVLYPIDLDSMGEIDSCFYIRNTMALILHIVNASFGITLYDADKRRRLREMMVLRLCIISVIILERNKSALF